MDVDQDVVDTYSTFQPSEIRTMFLRIEKVVPEDVSARLESVCEIEDKLQWVKGDIVNEIWKNVQGSGVKNERGNPYTFLDVCFFVSGKYLRFSRSFNTVKAWALTARRYSPPLPFRTLRLPTI